MVVPGIYRHYKGSVYEVIGEAKHTETEETLILYRPISAPDEYWARPAAMWSDIIERNEYTGPRFTYLSSDLDELDGQRRFRLIEDIVEVYESQDMLPGGEAGFRMYPFYNRATGKVNWYGGEDNPDFDPNEAPDSLLLIPEFPEDNYRIMQDFIYESPYAFRDREALETAIEGKGAFRRFKTTVRRRGIEDAWYAYRDMRYRRAAREFCQEAGIDWASTQFAPKTG